MRPSRRLGSVSPHRVANELKSANWPSFMALCVETTKPRKAPGLAQVTVSVSPSTLMVLVSSGLVAGGFTTEPSVIEYLLPWHSQLMVSVTFATGQF
jgi:hypothetical protein